MRHKETLASLFFFLTITLMLLPLLLTFNDVITKFVERFALYPFLEHVIVPFQARVLQVLLQYSGFHTTAYQDGILVQGKQLQIGWNCLGWQSLLFFIASLLIGLRNRAYTL